MSVYEGCLLMILLARFDASVPAVLKLEMAEVATALEVFPPWEP
jgi:hypothetical protein